MFIIFFYLFQMEAPKSRGSGFGEPLEPFIPTPLLLCRIKLDIQHTVTAHG